MADTRHLRLIIPILVLLCGLYACSPTADRGSNDVSPPGESLTESVAQAEVDEIIDPTIGLENGDPVLGREYFYGENRGRCLTCHTLNGEGDPTGFALDDAGLRHDARWLAIFLDNPRNLRPEVAIMPPYRGDEGGAKIADIVQFLLTLKTQVDHPESTDVKPPDEPDPDHEAFGGYQGPHGGY